MRESRLYGSGRGARGNSRPYRERSFVHADCYTCSGLQLALLAHSLDERLVRSWWKLT
jgi:hypothetical protein